LSTEVVPVVRLANEIAAQFPNHPVPEAAQAIATHIRQFWDPRMRRELLTLDPEVAAELDERAAAAVAALRVATK